MESNLYSGTNVTPLAGVWIEIWMSCTLGIYSGVTPLAGVWIEIPNSEPTTPRLLSLPLRECGLKSY